MRIHKFHDVYSDYKDVTLCGIAVPFTDTTKKNYHVSCKNCLIIIAKQKKKIAGTK